NAALGQDITFSKIKSVIKDRFHHGIDFNSIDRKCQDCHEAHPPLGTVKKYDLHEPNVVDNRSCSVCHQEHLGPGPMKRVADLQCASCHNNRDIMEASAKKGATLPADAFHLRPHPPQQVVFEMPRPARGYTQVFASFDRDHPEFQLIQEMARDPNVLRFNHQRHFANDIPPVNGQKLDCNYCHKPEPGGRFYQRVNFAANCQACHALQFDVRNPDLRIPHGDVTLVRNFLRTLPAQYGDYARLKRRITRESDIRNFVVQQVRQLQAEFRSGEELERAVFFTTDPYKPQRNMAAAVRANFAGCAFCHEVKAAATGAPLVTKPIVVDRWMPQAHFNHAKHTSVRCDECHHANQSRETADVLMPARANCVVCHSPQTKVVSDCITCHTYHAPGQPVKVEVQAEPRKTAFKEMLLSAR
ncbi:MAG TPA: cytochrome c3 family protein, partial [Chthoniobacterales bacterium]|nr:cytochrome c3 family protein [Chthoniobacterales bacterium]